MGKTNRKIRYNKENANEQLFEQDHNQIRNKKIKEKNCSKKNVN